MDIILKTGEVWQVDFEFEPLAFIAAASLLVGDGDVAVFGAYEPTAELVVALTGMGAIPRAHLPEFFTSFDANRSEHPQGSAFEFPLGPRGFSAILGLDPSILRQSDIASFYDHFIAYRPGSPRTPLISFHDAACGGTLYLWGGYDQGSVKAVAARLGGSCARVRNPALAS